MAFGFGFNKQKVLNAAEKFVQQGKLQNAITEYEKILKADPKDLTVLEHRRRSLLTSWSERQGGRMLQECRRRLRHPGLHRQSHRHVQEAEQAQAVAGLRAAAGRTLYPAGTCSMMRALNTSRSRKNFCATGELEQAVRIFQKTLGNGSGKRRHAHQAGRSLPALGKKAEAWQIFSAAVDSLRARGATGPAEEIVQRMLTLDPSNSAGPVAARPNGL